LADVCKECTLCPVGLLRLISRFDEFGGTLVNELLQLLAAFL
jgi:hypothetical protein